MRDEVEGWSDALEAVLARCRHFDRVRVVRETGSTQDAARAAAGGRPGLVVAAGRQTCGRGQRGRRWEQGGDLGVAVTFVTAAGESGRVSRAAGVAAHEACAQTIRSASADARVGIKSPNDIVVSHAGAPGGRRKLAGVLIEQGDGLAMIGVGINVGQGEDDFGPALRGRACSLHMLGAECSRVGVIAELIRAMDQWLGASVDSIWHEWRVRLVEAE